MKFLIDKSPKDVARKSVSDLVMGQLLTPLTGYADAGGAYAIDNGAFSGFPVDRFRRLLERQEGRKADCLFVTCPDIVGAGMGIAIGKPVFVSAAGVELEPRSFRPIGSWLNHPSVQLDQGDGAIERCLAKAAGFFEK